ncbi:hypothetical protein EJB05_30622, partial [Eragrostis curvula]
MEKTSALGYPASKTDLEKTSAIRLPQAAASPSSMLEKGGSMERSTTPWASPGSPLQKGASMDQSSKEERKDSGGCGSDCGRKRVRSFSEWLEKEEAWQQEQTAQLQDMYPDYKHGTYLDSDDEADFDFLIPSVDEELMALVVPPVDPLPQEAIPPPHQIVEPAKVCSEQEVPLVEGDGRVKDPVATQAAVDGDGWVTVRKTIGARRIGK